MGLLSYKTRMNLDTQKLKEANRVLSNSKDMNVEVRKEKIAKNKQVIKEIKVDYVAKKSKRYKSFKEEKTLRTDEWNKAKTIAKVNKATAPAPEWAEMCRNVIKTKQLISASRYNYENDVFGDGKSRSLQSMAIRNGKYTFLILLTIAWVMPLLFMFNTSFKTQVDLYTSKMWSLPQEWEFSNYEEVLETMDFTSSFMNSLLITVSSNLLIISFGSMAAWMLVRKKAWYSNAILYTFIAAMIIPFQALMLPLMTVMNKIGFMNIFGLIIMYVGFGTSLSVFLMFGFLKGVPASLEEAAAISGLGPIGTFRKIVLPIMKPIFMTVVILNTMWIWNDFLLPQLVLSQTDDVTLPIALYSRVIGAFGSNLTMLMSGVSVIIIPAVIFFVFAQKHIIAGVTQGSVK